MLMFVRGVKVLLPLVVLAAFLLSASVSAMESQSLFPKKIQKLEQKTQALQVEIQFLELLQYLSSLGGGSTDNLDRKIQSKTQKLNRLQEKLDELQTQANHHAGLVQQGWKLKHRDEFNGKSINSNKWSHEKNCWGGGNNEQQCYTDRVENSMVQGGDLHIIAREEAFSGPGVPDDDPAYNPDDTSRTLPYTSARLRSKDKIDFKYGRVEVRAKVVGGQGMWPAIWMLPTDYVYGGWPSSGEIDIMETVNLGIWPNELHGTLHYGLPWPQWENHGTTKQLDTNPADDYHVYAVEWEADEIRWYIDGEHYQTQRSEGWYNYIWQGQSEGFGVANPRAPFDQDFHLIMNLAVGGDWPGTPDTGWAEPREMLVDYVRVYQCKQDTLTGVGCGTIDPSIQVNADAGAPGVNDYFLYQDGPQTVSLDDSGSIVSNTVVPGFWEFNQGSLSQDHIDIGGEHGIVWDINFGGLANIFLSSEDMSADPIYDTGMQMAGGSGWTNNGELEFDMLVESASPDSQLTVKLDSGWPNQGQVAIDIPESGEWQRVSVRVSDLMANPNPSGGGVDISNIANPFVLEYSGSYANVKIDNIRLQCAYNTEPESWQLDQNCSLAPKRAPVIPMGDTHDVYVDSVTDWEPFDCCGGAAIAEVNDAGNNMLEFTYDSDPNSNTVTFFGLAGTRDMSHYAGGTLEFDMLVTQQPSNPAATPWLYKVDCGSSCSTGDLPITDSVEAVNPTTGVWQHYTINVDTLVSRGLDLSKVSAIVIWPAWGNQDDAVYRLDNIQWNVGGAGNTGPFDVTVTVDMSQESLTASDQVFVSGSWDGWCGGCTPLNNNGDGTWSGTLSLVSGAYDYKFQVNEWADQESVPPEPDCGVTKFGFTNRELVVENGNIQVQTTPYGGCPGGASGPTEPTVAAPNPSDNPANVISIFSDAFTNIGGVDYTPFWGQATSASIVDVAGNDTLRYANLNYQGTDFSGNPQNVSGFTHVHVDFWTDDSTAANFYLISPGPAEVPYSLPIATGQWVSVDIPLSHFSGVVDLTSVIQLKVDGNGTLYLDNIYFK